MSWVTVAMTGMNAFNQIQQGRTAKAQAGNQAAMADYQAKVEQENALKTAEVIRRAGRRQVGQAVAAFAGAGVKVGEGSAGEVERDITQGYEDDAFQALLDGGRRASGLRLDGQLTRIDGSQKQAAAYVNAAGTVLQGVGQYARATGWTTKGPAGWDAGGFNGTNDRGRVSVGNSTDWWLRNGRSGD